MGIKGVVIGDTGGSSTRSVVGSQPDEVILLNQGMAFMGIIFSVLTVY